MSADGLAAPVDRAFLGDLEMTQVVRRRRRGYNGESDGDALAHTRGDCTMSSASDMGVTEYPETDGQPMGETDLHRDWMIRILDMLRYRYRGRRVYVGCDLIVYFEEGEPSRYVVPDAFVALDCARAIGGCSRSGKRGKPRTW